MNPYLFYCRRHRWRVSVHRNRRVPAKPNFRAVCALFWLTVLLYGMASAAVYVIWIAGNGL